MLAPPTIGTVRPFWRIWLIRTPVGFGKLAEITPSTPASLYASTCCVRSVAVAELVCVVTTLQFGKFFTVLLIACSAVEPNDVCTMFNPSFFNFSVPHAYSATLE